MEQWTPLALAAAAILGAVLAAVVSVRVNRSSNEAHAAREFNRWLAEQRMARYVQAHDLQRDLIFTANGILKLQVGRRRQFLEANQNTLYNYARWLSLTDELRSTAASLRMLGAAEVADHLAETLDHWWADKIRTAMRDFRPGITQPPDALHAAWSDQGEMTWYVARTDLMVEIGRYDIRLLTSPAS